MVSLSQSLNKSISLVGYGFCFLTEKKSNGLKNNRWKFHISSERVKCIGNIKNNVMTISEFEESWMFVYLGVPEWEQ